MLHLCLKKAKNDALSCRQVCDIQNFSQPIKPAGPLLSWEITWNTHKISAFHICCCVLQSYPNLGEDDDI